MAIGKSPLDPDTITKSAFTTPFGLFQFRVMPFGMENMPDTFQPVVDRLPDRLQDFTRAYLDDIAIHSNTWEENFHYIGMVMDQIRGAGLTVTPDKCHIGMSEVQYL